MGYQLVTPPAVDQLVVSLAEAKVAARVTTSSEDAYIQTLIDAALEIVQTFTSRKLVSQTWKWILDCWPYDAEFLLPFAPVSAVSLIEYYNSSGSKVTWDASNYQVDVTAEPARVHLSSSSYLFPQLQINKTNAVEVTFVTGYANAAAVPKPIKVALMVQFTEMYNKRQPAEKNPKLLDSVERMLYPYILWDLG